MEQQLWNLFRETGEPMGYLLVKAEENARKKEEPSTQTQPQSTQAPSASM